MSDQPKSTKPSVYISPDGVECAKCGRECKVVVGCDSDGDIQLTAGPHSCDD